MPETYIVSDLHAGSPFFDRMAFTRFLDRLPPAASLILNGDVINRWHTPMPDEHAATLERLADEAARRQIIWLTGNHDDAYAWHTRGRIRQATEWCIERRLLVTHGHDFDHVMRHNGFALAFFRLLHAIYQRMGHAAVHPAEFAKRFRLLYDAMCGHISHQAIKHARSRGFEAITCGHTHHVEDRRIDGIRYINTGSWTEKPHCFVRVGADTIQLVRFNQEQGNRGARPAAPPLQRPGDDQAP